MVDARSAGSSVNAHLKKVIRPVVHLRLGHLTGLETVLSPSYAVLPCAKLRSGPGEGVRTRQRKWPIMVQSTSLLLGGDIVPLQLRRAACPRPLAATNYTGWHLRGRRSPLASMLQQLPQLPAAGLSLTPHMCKSTERPEWMAREAQCCAGLWVALHLLFCAAIFPPGRISLLAAERALVETKKCPSALPKVLWLFVMDWMGW